ncbi:hypothetical protein LPJ63_004314 [Coemansia sp. RSA 2711]|nr:hypothetical protein LPJ63_004314 [Coemansia sp. RSA 2711]
MHSKPPSPATPASPVPAEDPLLQMLCCLGEPEPLDSLYALFCSSSDIRASLRLLPPAYMDALYVATAAAREAAGLADSARPAGSLDASGTDLERILTNAALAGSDSAAAMLASLLDNDDAASVVTRRISPQETATIALLPRVKSQSPELDSFARLLRILNQRAAASASRDDKWVGNLLVATTEAVAAIPKTTNDSSGSQVLCLLSQLLSEHWSEAAKTLVSLDSLRRLVRHLIKLLGRPPPLIAAPALHALTRILLHPHDTAADGTVIQTPLTKLAADPGGKLFDSTHMNQTLVLVADFCLNCHAASGGATEPDAASMRATLIDSDLCVLDAVTGFIDAISNAPTTNIRERFYHSLAIVPAIDHLLSMAELDRRYLNPLLRIVNSILTGAGGDMALPLVASLVQSNASESASALTQDTAGYEPSVIDSMVYMVISGIDDVVDTSPRFVLPPVELDSRDSEKSLAPIQPWPRVSSEEGGCGWFVNCSRQQRQSVLRFLQLVLPMQTGQEQLWMRELFASALQVLHDFIQPSTSPQEAAHSPFGVDSWKAEPDSRERNLGVCRQRARAECHALAIGCYYWTVKPVLSFVKDLVGLSPAAAAYWRDLTADGKLAEVMAWAVRVRQKTANMPEYFYGCSLFGDIGDILTWANRSQHTELPSKRPRRSAASVQPSVATPSDSSPSSSSTSPRLDCEVIAIDELRAASASTGLGATSTSELAPDCGVDAAILVQAAVIRHWARSCEFELAATLELSCGISFNDIPGIKHGSNTLAQVRQAQLTVAMPADSHCQQHVASPFLEGLRMAAMVQKQASQQHIVGQTEFAHQIRDRENSLAAAELDNARLHDELQQLKTQSAQQQAQHAQQQQNMDAANRELEASVAEHRQRQVQLETDASEWKDECIRTRDFLEQSEASGRLAHEQLAKLTAEHEQLQDTHAANRSEWEQQQRAAASSAQKLESALGDAIARLRELESQNAAERTAADDLRSQLAMMGAKLAEYSKLSETLYNLSRLPH